MLFECVVLKERTGKTTILVGHLKKDTLFYLRVFEERAAQTCRFVGAPNSNLGRRTSMCADGILHGSSKTPAH